MRNAELRLGSCERQTGATVGQDELATFPRHRRSYGTQVEQQAGAQPVANLNQSHRCAEFPKLLAYDAANPNRCAFNRRREPGEALQKHCCETSGKEFSRKADLTHNVLEYLPI